MKPFITLEENGVGELAAFLPLTGLLAKWAAGGLGPGSLGGTSIEFLRSISPFEKVSDATFSFKSLNFSEFKFFYQVGFVISVWGLIKVGTTPCLDRHRQTNFVFIFLFMKNIYLLPHTS